jgi:hypothetical protein
VGSESDEETLASTPHSLSVSVSGPASAHTSASSTFGLFPFRGASTSLGSGVDDAFDLEFDAGLHDVDSDAGVNSAGVDINGNADASPNPNAGDGDGTGPDDTPRTAEDPGTPEAARSSGTPLTAASSWGNWFTWSP